MKVKSRKFGVPSFFLFLEGGNANLVLSAIARRIFYHVSIFKFSIASKWESLEINVRSYC